MKHVFFPTLLALVLAVACTKPVSPQEQLTANDAKINEIIAQMTLEKQLKSTKWSSITITRQADATNVPFIFGSPVLMVRNTTLKTLVTS